MQNTKPASLIVIILLMGVLTLTPVLSSITETAVIGSTGTIASESNPSEITAQSGSPGHIQAAVNQMAAAGGGTVRIPEGTFNFNDETVDIPGGVNVIGAGIGKTILQQTKAMPFHTMFYLESKNGKPIRISGIEFRGLVTSNDRTGSHAGNAIEIFRGTDIRIDHNKFIDFPDSAIWVGNYYTDIPQPKCVIDHNIIDNPYKDTVGGIWGYGIEVIGPAGQSFPDITQFLGKYETIPSRYPVAYIEDNVISRTRHAIASNQGGWYVARYNSISQGRPAGYGYIDVHGANQASVGGRGLEAYNNQLNGNSIAGALGFAMRGGGGAIYDNTFSNFQDAIRILRDNDYAIIPLSQLYIWSNNFVNTDNQINNYDHVYDQNVHYFLREPNQAQDGFTYTPYPYPHPLTTS